MYKKIISGNRERIEEKAPDHVLAVELAHFRSLVQIGISLQTIEDDDIIPFVLQHARTLLHADSGRIFLLDPSTDDHLHLAYGESDSKEFELPERYTVALHDNSLVSHVARNRKIISIGNVADIPPDSTYTFNWLYINKDHYPIRSVLTIPMICRKGKPIGVLQLMNRKPAPDIILNSTAIVDEHVIPFTETCEVIGLSLAGLAAVALENKSFYQQMSRLVRGFVEASVNAIELRDPCTAGHSQRVSKMVVALAKVINQQTTGPYKDVIFSEDELTELAYASLLHDFGKVATREHILIKSSKLFPHELDRIINRFEIIKQSVEIWFLQEIFKFMEAGLTRADLEDEKSKLSVEKNRRIQEIENDFEVIKNANEPSPLSEEVNQQLMTIASRTYTDSRGLEKSYLTNHELTALCIARGSLTNDERQHIEEHAKHSFKILGQIPWIETLQNVPNLALTHHERLDGTGYPQGLTGEKLTLKDRIIPIADIFDALTAADRPYKKAMSLDRALTIIEREAELGGLDKVLIKLFITHRIWEILDA